MMAIIWKSEYSVGIEKFDNEHKKLIEIINRLNEAMSVGKSKEVMGSVITELIKYTHTHFKNEEEYQKSIGYPDYQNHLKIHKYFISKMEEFDNRFKTSNIGLGVDVMMFLRDWLIKHITVEDKKYSEFSKIKIK
jgi:hemerythrin-like metal-binding protein